jgi:hypothetical protein
MGYLGIEDLFFFFCAYLPTYVFLYFFFTGAASFILRCRTHYHLPLFPKFLLVYLVLPGACNDTL